MISKHERAGQHSVNPLAIELERLQGVVAACFPTVAEEVEVCLAVAATLLLEDLQNPIALNLVGPPSSLKTTVADMFDRAGEDKV